MFKLRFFKPSELKPAGWLRRELEVQAEGLSGNLDKIWPDVRDSRWIGGDREGWERVPYWLDGFIPLAYLLGVAASLALFAVSLCFPLGPVVFAAVVCAYRLILLDC